MDAQSILVQFDHLFQVQNIFSDMLRYLLWLIVQGLAWINGFVQDIATEILTLNGFIDYSGITSIYEDFKPLFFAIMGIALVASGYMLMFGSQSTSKLAKNVLFAVVVVTMLPAAMTQMNKVVQEGVEAINGNYSSISNAVIQQNVADLYAYDEANFQVDPNVPYNQIPEESIMYIDPNAKIDKEKVDNTEVFENKIDVNESNNVVLEPLGQGLLENDQTYYRYDINFIAIIVVLAVTIFAMLSFAVKMVKIMFELAVNKIFGLLVAGADINSGQRTKQVLQNIFGLFGSIFMMALSMQVYIELIAYSTNSGISIASQVVVLIGGSWALLQGASIVEKVLGVGVGLNEAGKMLQAGMSMVNAGGNIAGGVGKMGAAAAGVAVGASSAAAGIAAGYKAGSEIKQPNSGKLSDDRKSQVTEPNGSKVKTSNPGMAKDQRTAGLDANRHDPSQVPQPGSSSAGDKNTNLSSSQNPEDINNTAHSDSMSNPEDVPADLNNTEVSDVAQPDSISKTEGGTADLTGTDVSNLEQPDSLRTPGSSANSTSQLANPKVKNSNATAGNANPRSASGASVNSSKATGLNSNANVSSPPQVSQPETSNSPSVESFTGADALNIGQPDYQGTSGVAPSSQVVELPTSNSPGMESFTGADVSNIGQPDYQGASGVIPGSQVVEQPTTSYSPGSEEGYSSTVTGLGAETTQQIIRNAPVQSGVKSNQDSTSVSVSGNKQQLTSNGHVEGHRYTRSQNTLFGQSNTGRKMARTKDQSYNTGYNIGMKFNPNFKKGKGDS